MKKLTTILLFCLSLQAYAGWYQSGSSWKYVADNWHALLAQYESSNPKPAKKAVMPSKPAGHKGLWIFDSKHPQYATYQAAKRLDGVAYTAWSAKRSAWVNAKVQAKMLATKPAAADMKAEDKIKSGSYGDDYSVNRPGPTKCSDLSFGGPPANPCNGRAQGSVVGSSAPATSSAPAAASNPPAAKAKAEAKFKTNKLTKAYVKAWTNITYKFQKAFKNLDCIGLSSSMCLKLKERIIIDMQLAQKSIDKFYAAMGGDLKGVIVDSDTKSQSISTAETASQPVSESQSEQAAETSTQQENREPASTSESTAEQSSSSCNSGVKVQCTSTIPNATFKKTCNASGGYGACVFDSCNQGFDSGLSLGGTAPASCRRAN